MTLATLPPTNRSYQVEAIEEERELVALLLLYSVDGRCHVSVVVLCLFLTLPLLVYTLKCVIVALMVKLTYFFLHDKTILYEVYVLTQDNFV